MEAGKSWTKKILSENQRVILEKKIALLEEKTGIELVVCILKSADNYPVAALNVALFFSLISSLFLSFLFSFSHEYLFVIVQIFLFTFFYFLGRFSYFKRLGVTDLKKQIEFNEKAGELFFKLGIYRTQNQNGAQLLISLFERKISLLVDEGVLKRMGQEELDKLVKTLSKDFKEKDFFVGLTKMLETIENNEGLLLSSPQKKFKEELQNTLRWFDFS